MRCDTSLSVCSCPKCMETDMSKEILHNIKCLGTIKQLLLNGAKVNFQTQSGWCPLFEAISLNLEYTVEFLLSCDADINIKDIKGRNALFWAIYYDKPQMVQLLLDNGINIYDEIFPGLTPIQYALEVKNIIIYEMLLNFNIHEPKTHKDSKKVYNVFH